MNEKNESFQTMRIKRRTDQWGWNQVEEQAFCPGMWCVVKKSHPVNEVIVKKKVAASPRKKSRRVQRDLAKGWGQHADDCKGKQEAV